MNTIDKKAINKSQKGVRVDFQYFIQSDVNQELPWKTLVVFLTDLTTTPKKSKEVIKILVEELEKWVTKARNRNKVVVDENDKDFETVKENIMDSEGSVNEVNGDPDFIQENKTANEEIIESEIKQEPSASDGDKMQEQYHNESMSSYQENIQSLSKKEKLTDKVDAFKDELYTFVGSDPENDEVNELFDYDDTSTSQYMTDYNTHEEIDQLEESEAIEDEETQEVQNDKEVFEQLKANDSNNVIHTLQNESDETKLPENEVVIVDGEKMYKCKICGKIVKHIRAHIGVHAGQKNYKCTVNALLLWRC